MTRVEQFCSAHRLHSVHLNSQENINLYGKCNHPNFHGHNYKLVVTLKGPVNPTTGMVMNISTLKKILKESVLDLVDHKNLDMDIDFFRNNPSTTENLCIFIWNQLKPKLPLIHSIKIHETEKNIFEYRG